MSQLTRHGRVFLLLAFLLPALLVLAACEDDADDAPAEEPTPTEEVAEEVPTPEPAETPITDDAATDDDEPTPTPETAETPVPAPDDDDDEEVDDGDPRSVLVYLTIGEELAAASRDIAGTPEVATGALNELFTGTTPYEEDHGYGTEIPFETRLLGISIEDDGTALVDLSGDFETGGGSLSMQMRVAQVVFTLTQFDSVDAVQFQIEGQDVDSIGGEGILVDQPVDRDDFEDLSPAILLESPTLGQEVSSPLRLQGTANTFEATIQIEIIDNSGEVVYRDFGTATSGSGFRGEFDFEIDVDITQEGTGSIVLFEESAQDGSRINVIEVPVDFRY